MVFAAHIIKVFAAIVFGYTSIIIHMGFAVCKFYYDICSVVNVT